jgi:hypothetical protein
MPLQHGAAKGVDMVGEDAHAASATGSSDSKPGVGSSTGFTVTYTHGKRTWRCHAGLSSITERLLYQIKDLHIFK